MTDNIFVNRFNKMTNDELEAISFNEDTYTDEARLTALDILKSRDVNTEAINAAHSTLAAGSIATEKIVLDIPGSTETFTAINTKTEPLPELYSKKLILVISILFSTLIGSILLISNLKKVGHRQGMIQVIIFSCFYLFVPVTLISTLNINPQFAILANVLGGYILTEYFWNKFLGKAVEYKKRDWSRAVLIILAITIPLSYFVLKSGGAI
ncbi:conserved hypothetical membrane protein [Formosa agariphila KMM 3901]|uniref:Conserved hypothetical membrane protein n=1 Tax=Formosa agariphila (strain DSM 15362 / KCTC 12365 / LMG 23005 / KMM 3901 / M-2Alg 35-1) TaxID=1347342 RepID=T2KKP0_FORAG|nr:hypothetical protein [Formosa agariphila]CDF78579.1 conserved hypothetical membrane protein [Formosa agariphila KMM 3901]